MVTREGLGWKNANILSFHTFTVSKLILSVGEKGRLASGKLFFIVTVFLSFILSLSLSQRSKWANKCLQDKSIKSSRYGREANNAITYLEMELKLKGFSCSGMWSRLSDKFILYVVFALSSCSGEEEAGDDHGLAPGISLFPACWGWHNWVGMQISFDLL